MFNDSWHVTYQYLTFDITYYLFTNLFFYKFDLINVHLGDA